MQEAFQTILNIQELDISMIRLMKLKKERQNELFKVNQLKEDVQKQVANKESEIVELKKDIRIGEIQIKEIQEKISKLEAQQASVKKIEEFNALTHEMTAAGREKSATEHRLSDLTDKLSTEEDLLNALKENLSTTRKNSDSIEKEILDGIDKINKEGREILEKRNSMKSNVSQDFFNIYERLLKNKRDRVVVPIEGRVCGGCHILLTAQHENLVRKEDRLVFCEHCSRILYWQEAKHEEIGETAVVARRRRRRVSAATPAGS